MHCKSELNLCKLCVNKVQSKCLDSHQLNSRRICSHHIDAVKLNVESEVANNICAQSVMANNVGALNLNSNYICSQQGTINTLCVDNLTLGNFSPVIKYRATVNYSANVTYTLGDFVNFNNIVDDPNNNVSLSPNTSYTVPVSGYYMMTFKANVQNLVSNSGPVLGVPIANPEVWVNGILVRESFSPFLTFFNAQKVILNSLITLSAGDVVTLKYNVLANNGVPIIGSVDILGAGPEDGDSLFKIILLSGLGSGSASACIVCPPVQVPCMPVSVVCDDCDGDNNQSPCGSCE